MWYCKYMMYNVFYNSHIVTNITQCCSSHHEVFVLSCCTIQLQIGEIENSVVRVCLNNIVFHWLFDQLHTSLKLMDRAV